MPQAEHGAEAVGDESTPNNMHPSDIAKGTNMISP